MIKYCSNCGKPYEEGTAFCAGCGASLAGGVPAKAGFKSAITKEGISQVIGKSVKVFTVILLVMALLFAVQNLFGTVEVGVAQYDEGELYRYTVTQVRALYPEMLAEDSYFTIAPLVANILFGLVCLGVAALAGWVLLEKTFGGDYQKLFKLLAIVALGAVSTYILIYLIFGSKQEEFYRVAVEAPVTAWVALVTSGLAFVAGLLQPKD